MVFTQRVCEPCKGSHSTPGKTRQWEFSIQDDGRRCLTFLLRNKTAMTTTPPDLSALDGDGAASAIESRPLSAFEDMFARSAPHLGMTCQWFRLSCAENNSPCSPDDIVAALHRVHRRIVPLRCVLEKTPDATIALVVRKGLKPDISIVDDDDGSYADADDHGLHLLLEQLAAREVSEGFGPTADCYHDRPLWRARVLPRHGWVVVTFHHAICDGSSRKIFTAELMDALEKSGEGNDDDDKYAFHPGADDLLKKALQKQTAQVQTPTKEQSRETNGGVDDPAAMPQCWPKPDKAVPLTERSIQAPSAAIPNASRLRHAARSHDVTVSAVLLAALAMVVRNQMDEVDASEPIAVSPVTMGVDVRRHLSDVSNSNGNKQLFGCYVIGGSIDAKVNIQAGQDTSSIWDLARHMSSEIPEATTLSHSVRKCKELKAMLDVPMTPEALSGIMGMINGPTQGRTGPGNLSNIGVVPSESSAGTIQMDRLFSITSQTSMGSYAFMNAATVNDHMCVTLGSVKPIVTRERDQAMLKDLREIIEGVIGLEE